MVFSGLQARRLLLAIIGIVVVGLGVLHLPVYMCLAVALFVTVFAAWRQGEPLDRIGRAVGQGLAQSRNVLVILFLISILIGLWKLNGTLATLIYYGFNLIQPQAFLAMVFVLCSLVSMLLGTAIGTVSTIGIALLGLAESMGLPRALVAGAIVAGAFVGDRSAPTSGPLHLAATATRTRATDLVPYLFTTLAPTYLLSLAFYFAAGFLVHPSPLAPGTVASYQELLLAHFPVAFFLLLPPLLLLTLAVLRVGILKNLFVTLVATVACSLAVGLSPGNILRAAVWGYRPSAAIPFIAVLSGGGILSFTTIFLVIMTAMALTGLLEATGAIRQATAGVLAYIHSVPRLILFTVIFSILVGAVASTQTVAILIPAAVFLPYYRQFGLDNLVLARAIADSGVPVSGIIPWSIAALSPALVLGVPVTAFAPYAVFCWLSPLVNCVFAHLGWVKKYQPAASTSVQLGPFPDNR